MKAKSRKLLSALLVLMMIFSLFAAIPGTASAANTNVAIAQSDSVGTIRTKIQQAIDAANSGDTVTITGTKNNANAKLSLNIPFDITVIWKASYSGTVNYVNNSDSMIALTGTGAFDVAAGGAIRNNGTTPCIRNYNSTSSKVVVSGGTVSSKSIAILGICSITVSGGSVSSDQNSTIGGYGSDVTISGGIVSTETGVAVGTSNGVNLLISGGTVKATGADGGIIYSTASTDVITISGGTLSAIKNGIVARGEVNISGGTVTTDSGDTIHTQGDGSKITVSGNAEVSSSAKRAIYAEGKNSSVTITSGTVTSDTETAIWAPGAGSRVTINGGTISSGGAYATISVSDEFVMNGGKVENTGTADAVVTSNATINSGLIRSNAVSAVYAGADNAVIKVTGGNLEAGGEGWSHAVCAGGSGAAIDISGGTLLSVGTNGTVCSKGAGSTVKVSSGFVGALGTSISGSESKTAIYMASGTPTIDGTAVVIAWNYPDVHPTYSAGSSTDLVVGPDAATVIWDIDGAQPGMRYSNGSNTEFMPINSVTVTLAAATINPTSVTYNKNGGDDILITADLGGNTLQNIKNGSYTLQSGTDFTTSGNTVTVKNAYLNTLAVGTHTLTFEFNGGSSPTLVITVTEISSTASMSNFTKVNTYTRGQFNDVNEALWYGFDDQKVIATAYEYGLMVGTSYTKFNPTGSVTIAQAITIASRVHKIYFTGDGEFVQGPVWYQVYVDYAIANGIIGAGNFADYNKAATRAEMAYIFSAALPSGEFVSQNTVNTLPDVNSGTPYYNAILMLYKSGVVAGSDTQGTFNPNNNITRAEAAAIISRVILPATRFSGRTFG